MAAAPSVPHKCPCRCQLSRLLQLRRSPRLLQSSTGSTGAGRAVLGWAPQPCVSAATPPSLHTAPSRTDPGCSTVTPCQRCCADSAPTGFVPSHVLWPQHISWAGKRAGWQRQLLSNTGFGTSTVHPTCSRMRLQEWPGWAVSPATCMTQLCDEGEHQHKAPQSDQGSG